jgi:hypothetical protein
LGLARHERELDRAVDQIGKRHNDPNRHNHLDHMRPASANGPDHLLKYAPAHESCKGRGNRPPTAEHERRFREAWLGYESNGHTQILSR